MARRVADGGRRRPLQTRVQAATCRNPEESVESALRKSVCECVESGGEESAHVPGAFAARAAVDRSGTGLYRETLSLCSRGGSIGALSCAVPQTGRAIASLVQSGPDGRSSASTSTYRAANVSCMLASGIALEGRQRCDALAGSAVSWPVSPTQRLVSHRMGSSKNKSECAEYDCSQAALGGIVHVEASCSVKGRQRGIERLARHGSASNGGSPPKLRRRSDACVDSMRGSLGRVAASPKRGQSMLSCVLPQAPHEQFVQVASAC